MAESPTNPDGIRVDSLAVIVHNLLDELKTRGTTPELPTGIPGLDQSIWGLHRAELTVIAARPGVGKTSLSLQIALNLAEQHKKVLFLSLEMTRQQMAERLLVQMTQTDAWTLRIGKDMDDFHAKLAPLLTNGTFEKMNLRIVDRLGYTIPQVQHVMAKMVEEGGGPPDLLVIDFIQLIRLEGGLQRFDAIAEYFIALKELAMRYNMAVLVCSQVNREGTKGEAPKIENLKGSGALEELSDVVVVCHWQELGTEERPQGFKYWLIISKNRYGPPGVKIPVRFDMQKLTFHTVEFHVEEWQENGKMGEDVKV